MAPTARLPMQLPLCDPVPRGLEIVVTELMAALVRMGRNLRAGGLEQLCEPFDVVSRGNRISPARTKQCREIPKVWRGNRNEGHHGPKQNGCIKKVRFFQKQAARDIRSVRVPDRNQFRGHKSVLSRSRPDEMT